MATAIIGVGNLGSTVARHLVAGDEPVVLAAADEAHAKALAVELGPKASAASVEDAIAGADAVVLATWLDQTKELAPGRTRLFESKIVVDPSNPIGFDENGQMIRTLPEGQSSGSVVAGLLPASAHFVKAFGSLGATQLASGANHEPRTVLFYATDDDVAEATAQRLIRAAGFEPLKVGGLSQAGRIEGPDGELQGQIFDLDEARPTIRNRRSKDMSATDTVTLPDYAPIPREALGPALNEQGYYVGRVERNLYYVTDGTYMAAFLTTSDGVVVLDAPPTLGNNLQRAIDEIAAANGVSSKVSHLIYSHHHSDHVGAASLFDKNAARIGHEETRNLLLRDNDPARPPNEETFQDQANLVIGGEHINLAWHGSNHSPDNIFIHLPEHDTMMLVDIVNPGWVPIYQSNLSEDIPGYLEAPATALGYQWTHFIGGHMGRLGTRDDLALHQQYMADISESSRNAIDTVDPTPYFVKYGENFWAALKGYLDECAATTAAPVIEKYTGVLAAADVFTEDVAFQVMQSIRLDLGYGAQVHP